MAWISASVKPRAMRSITVAARVPARNSCRARAMAARSSPASRGTGETTRAEAGWQPEHAAAPGGGSSAAQAVAVVAAKASAAASALRIRYTIWIPWFLRGNVRMRRPVALKYAFSTAGAATQIVGSPTPPQNPPDGITMHSTFGIWAIRIES